jgi:hypothetical protein
VCVFWSNFLISAGVFWRGAGTRKLLLGDDEVRNEHNLKIWRQMPKSISPLRLSVRATRTPIAAAARRRQRRRSFPNHGRAHTKVSRRPPPPLSGSGSHSACIMRAAHADFPNFRQIKGCTTSGGYTTSSKQPHGRF